MPFLPFRDWRSRGKMPEGVAKEAKDDAKGKAKEASSPRRRVAGNIARVKVELLDGSTMELDVDVSGFLYKYKRTVWEWTNGSAIKCIDQIIGEENSGRCYNLVLQNYFQNFKI